MSRARARSPARVRRRIADDLQDTTLLPRKKRASAAYVEKPERAPLFDETNRLAEFFFRPHTASAVLILGVVLAYTAMGEHSKTLDRDTNIRRGVLTAMGVFLLYCFLQARDGLFVRPHPAVWRVVKGIAVLYLVFLVFLLFQSVDDARQIMKFLDPSVGVPLEEKMYAADCRLFTPGDPRGPMANIKETFLDEFFLAHLLGWFGKALILRDVWLTLTYSVLFELWELTLKHQLPNFAECWWDQIILDILFANGLGMFLGLRVCQYLEMREYDWVGIGHYKTMKGKMKRAAQQLMPASYEHYEWRIFSGWRPLFGFVCALAIMSIVELNAFYLKTTLWLPPSNPLVVGRLVVWWLIAIPGMREYYQFLSDPDETKMGTMAWLSMALALVETLIVYKYGVGVWREAVMPLQTKLAWSAFVVLFVSFFTWFFYFRAKPKTKRV